MYHVKPDNTSVDYFQNEHFITKGSPSLHPIKPSHLSGLVVNTLISGKYLSKAIILLICTKIYMITFMKINSMTTF